MGLAKFIYDRFLNKELCVFLGDYAEHINYDQSSSVNWSYYCGVVKEVDVENEVIVLLIPEVGIMYIDSTYNVKAFWEPGFSLSNAMKTSLTKHMVGSRRINK
jgi:hypothetical protein